MKLIAIEEHFLTADIRAAWDSSAIGQEGTAEFDRGEIGERLNDLGQRRIALMDESGVDVQVLAPSRSRGHGTGVVVRLEGSGIALCPRSPSYGRRAPRRAEER